MYSDRKRKALYRLRRETSQRHKTLMVGTCGLCGKELDPTVVVCGCNKEAVEADQKQRRIRHLTCWIKEKKKEIIRATKRIAEMEEELDNYTHGENSIGSVQSVEFTRRSPAPMFTLNRKKESRREAM